MGKWLLATAPTLLVFLHIFESLKTLVLLCFISCSTIVYIIYIYFYFIAIINSKCFLVLFLCVDKSLFLTILPHSHLVFCLFFNEICSLCCSYFSFRLSAIFSLFFSYDFLLHSNLFGSFCLCLSYSRL